MSEEEILNPLELNAECEYLKTTLNLIDKLQQKVNQLETNRDEVLEMINTQVDVFESDRGMWEYYIGEIKKILERGKE